MSDHVTPLIVPCLRGLQEIVARRPEVFSDIPDSKIALKFVQAYQDEYCEFGILVEGPRVLVYTTLLFDRKRISAEDPTAPAESLLESIRESYSKTPGHEELALDLKRTFVNNFKAHYYPVLGLYLARQQLDEPLKALAR